LFSPVSLRSGSRTRAIVGFFGTLKHDPEKCVAVFRKPGGSSKEKLAEFWDFVDTQAMLRQ